MSTEASPIRTWMTAWSLGSRSCASTASWARIHAASSAGKTEETGIGNMPSLITVTVASPMRREET